MTSTTVTNASDTAPAATVLSAAEQEFCREMTFLGELAALVLSGKLGHPV